MYNSPNLGTYPESYPKPELAGKSRKNAENQGVKSGIPSDSANIAPVDSAGGYVVNLSGFSKPTAIYLRYAIRPVNKICNFLKCCGLVGTANQFKNFNRAILKILWRRFDRVILAHGDENTGKNEGLSTTKNK